MPIRLVDSGDVDQWYEQDDAIRVFFDSSALLERAGMPIEDASQSPETFIPVLESALGDLADTRELRSPGPEYGPHAGGGIESFIDVVITAKDIVEAVAVAYLVARKLIDEGVGGVRVSTRGIEEFARQQLRARGYDEHSRLVGIDLIPIKTHLTGPPPGFEGYSVVFALDDGRLVTMRWTLDGRLETFSVGEPDSNSDGE